MKHYVVWNMTNYGNGFEFFGVCKTKKKANELYRKACEQYGIDPKLGFDEEDDCTDVIRIDEIEMFN